MSRTLSEIEEASIGTLKVVKVDASDDPQSSASLQVTVVPTFLLFRRGEQVAQITGARSKKDLKKWIDESLEGGS